MRSIEYLARLFPDKTGSQLIEIQNSDKAEDEKLYREVNKRKIEIVDDINTNGAYYRGTFGLSQHFYYYFSKAELNKETITCTVSSLTCFFDSDGRIKIELDNERYALYENFGVAVYERIEKGDYLKVIEYLNASKTLFWISPPTA